MKEASCEVFIKAKNTFENHKSVLLLDKSLFILPTMPHIKNLIELQIHTMNNVEMQDDIIYFY